MSGLDDEIELHGGSVLQRNNEIMTAEMGDELVMLHLDQSSYFGLDPIGRAIWERLQEPIKLDDLCASLREEFDIDEETCLADTTEFLRRLARNDLLTIDGQAVA